MYPESNVSGALIPTPSSPDAVSSLNVIVLASSRSKSLNKFIPACVKDAVSCSLTLIWISACELSPWSVILISVSLSNIRLVISCTVLSSRSKNTLPSAVLIANSPDSSWETIGFLFATADRLCLIVVAIRLPPS